MNKLKEYLDIDFGIFAEMWTTYPDEYNALFGDITPQSLDSDFYLMCGERYASNILPNVKLEMAVKMILNRYYDTWIHIRDMLDEDINALYPYYRKTSTQGQSNTQNTDTNSSNTDNNIYGFDSDTARGDSETIVNSENNSDGQTHTNTESIVIGNNGSYAYGELIAKEIETRARYFIQLVLNDVKSFLTLSIY